MKNAKRLMSVFHFVLKKLRCVFVFIFMSLVNGKQKKNRFENERLGNCARPS